MIDEIERWMQNMIELVNDVKDLRKGMMEHFEFQETRLEKEAMRIKMMKLKAMFENGHVPLCGFVMLSLKHDFDLFMLIYAWIWLML